MVKKLFFWPALLSLVAVTVAECQSPYLNLGQRESVKLLKSQGIEIMDRDSGYIHTVDETNLRNIILYFDEGLCFRVLTTFQMEQDFKKMANFFDMKFGYVDGRSWNYEFGGKVVRVLSVRREGYHYIDETIEEKQ